MRVPWLRAFARRCMHLVFLHCKALLRMKDADMPLVTCSAAFQWCVLRANPPYDSHQWLLFMALQLLAACGLRAMLCIQSHLATVHQHDL